LASLIPKAPWALLFYSAEVGAGSDDVAGFIQQQAQQDELGHRTWLANGGDGSIEEWKAQGRPSELIESDPKTQIGVTFEGGLYRSVPEGRNPLEIHPVFNTEKAIHRYTGEGQGGLYLGSSQRIVNSEFTGNGASIEGLVNNYYYVKVDGLLDLTNPSIRSELGVSLEELVRTGGSKEWRYEITNPLGRYAEDSGYNGIIAPAAQADGGLNVILFNPSLVK
ncbi:hypothetical protein, partial [Agarivorans gilvus]